MEWASVFPSGRSDDPVDGLVSGLATRGAPSLSGGAPARPAPADRRDPDAGIRTSSPSRVLRPLILGSFVVLVVAGCVQGGASDATAGLASAAGAAASSGSGRESTTPTATTPRTAASPTPPTAATFVPPTTTETAWGRIWDALPDAFPVYPGASPTDTGEGPASAIVDVPATTAKAVAWYRAALVRAGYSIEALAGPLEDGSTVIDAVGQHPTCRVQASIVPRGSRSIATIQMAAACPFR